MTNDSERAKLLSDQAFAFLGLAFAVYSPQLALLAALAIAPSHSIPLPLRGAGSLGVWPAFTTVAVLLVIDDATAAVFVLAAVARYDTVFALGQWPMRDAPRTITGADWSSRQAYFWSRSESWFFRRPYRALWAAIAMLFFFGVTSGYLLWLVWISL